MHYMLLILYIKIHLYPKLFFGHYSASCYKIFCINAQARQLNGLQRIIPMLALKSGLENACRT